ncbi:MAG: transcriptional repressor [Actinobacteria bacterium]|nr:transcriptional repressor [Actinomycetota bacterium]
MERRTAQRAAILEVLEGGRAFLSAQDLHDRLRSKKRSVGLTTVYRNLQSLVEQGVVDVVRTPAGESKYRLCSKDFHHHHLVCRHCGVSVEVESPEVEKWASVIARDHGFSDVTHELELFGNCTQCKNA